MRGVDGSFTELTVERARKLKSLGIEVWAQCLWTGAAQPSTRVTNLRAAEQGGLLTMGYISLDRTHIGAINGSWHIQQGRTGVPDDLWERLLLVPIDVELDGIPNEEIRRAVNHLWVLGTTPLNRRRAIYTNWNSWVNKQGNPRSFTDCLLWNALWDNDPDIDFDRLPFGGWTRKELVGEQYTGGTQFGGVYVDLDWFNRNLLIPPLPVKDPLLVELGVRRALMLAAGHLMEGEPDSLEKVVNIMAYLGYRFGD